MVSLKKAVLFFFSFLFYGTMFSQKSIRDSSISLVTAGIGYGGYFAAGDLADRFGYTNSMWLEAGYKFDNNLYILTGPGLIFGTNIKESIAGNVVVTGGGGFTWGALGADGRYTEIRFFERGYFIPVKVGKIFNNILPSPNPNSGLYLEVGGQFVQHKIKIDVIGNNVPALDPENRKGYDRLTNGFGVTEGIGYRLFSNNYLTNFYFGLEASQNFTKSRRTVNYDTGIMETDPRLDIFWGFKAAWVLPIYAKAPTNYYRR